MNQTTTDAPMIVALDSHAHLYDTFSMRAWVTAALENLSVGFKIAAADCCPSARCVFVVDREGQDSFARFRRELSDFASWEEWGDEGAGAEAPLIGSIKLHQGGARLYVIRGVQYVSVERIEVLGLGINREVNDGTLTAGRIIQIVNDACGVACLPWSPGKWLGARGGVVAEILGSGKLESVCFGDISLRAALGVPSLKLRRSQAMGFKTLVGSDPLPISFDEGLVGSYGVRFNIQAGEASGIAEIYRSIMRSLRVGDSEFVTFGGGFNPLKGLRRYLANRA